MQALDTAGAAKTEARSRIGVRLARTSRTFAARLTLLLVIFVAVPLILYGQFRAADAEKQRLLLRGAHDQGRLVAETLKPHLDRFGPRTVAELDGTLKRVAGEDAKIKVLFRPRGSKGDSSFYYVASAPPVSSQYLDAERNELVESGIFRRVPETCSQVDASASRFTNPKGEQEVLVSFTPVNTAAGCWVVIIARTTADYLGSGLARPYWETPQVRIAAIIYFTMVIFVIWLFVDGWRSLRRFERLAHSIRTRRSEAATFAAQNRMPELDGVAAEFDRMVGALRDSAQMMRYVAEDNAHAFKTPIAVIAQSVEPLRRAVAAGDDRSARALQMIEQSVERLDTLVSAARRMDEAAAEFIDPPRQAVDLARLVRRVGEDYADQTAERSLRVHVKAPETAVVLAGEELLETVIENLLDNAVSFSPPGGTVSLLLAVAGRRVRLAVEDQGPGVAPENLAHIFDRYFSHRPSQPHEQGSGGHSGIGLWIVRRNIEALGGTATAENRPDGGLRVTVDLPLA